MSKLHFRFIISPENQTTDLQLLTKEFISRLEMKTGYKFEWVAAGHYNTGHRHTRLLINGFDLNRKRAGFRKEVITGIMRETLRAYARKWWEAVLIQNSRMLFSGKPPAIHIPARTRELTP
jgi:hypothetical protein